MGDSRKLLINENVKLKDRESFVASSINTNNPAGNRTFPDRSFGLSDREAAILNNADYAFTGSYYNVHRNIMSFDPLDLLPQFKGKHPVHDLHNLLLDSNGVAIPFDVS